MIQQVVSCYKIVSFEDWGESDNLLTLNCFEFRSTNENENDLFP